jgi:hypothetical protein
MVKMSDDEKKKRIAANLTEPEMGFIGSFNALLKRYGLVILKEVEDDNPIFSFSNQANTRENEIFLAMEEVAEMIGFEAS